MPLTEPQKQKLQHTLFEWARTTTQTVDPLVLVKELWLAFFETAAERKVRAQGWIAVARAERSAMIAGADAATAATKAALTTDIADLDTLTTNV